MRPKSASSEVVGRAIAAGNVAALCFGGSGKSIRDRLERFALWRFVSDPERELFEPFALTEQAKGYHSWLVESVQSLAWSLSLAELDHFRHCDDTLSSLFPHNRDPSGFLDAARIRPLDEILQECDTLYMLHWCAVEVNLTGQSSRIELPLVQFRRHAADWVVGIAEAWDDVTMDT